MMNNDRLTHLLAEKRRLEAEIAPLNDKLANCDAALAAMDRALVERDRLPRNTTGPLAPPPPMGSKRRLLTRN
jgi:hypothetical protein